MSQASSTKELSEASLTALLLPLADRTLIVPNVAVAELIAYRNVRTSEGLPEWFVGQIAWRDLQLPLLSFEAASGAPLVQSGRAQVAVINALGGRPLVKFLAVLVQGIPRSVKIGSDLARAETALAELELDAVWVGDTLAKIPDFVGLEQKLADLGVI